MTENSYEVIAAIYAILKLECTCVLYDPNFKCNDLNELLNRINPVCVLIAKETYNQKKEINKNYDYLDIANDLELIAKCQSPVKDFECKEKENKNIKLIIWTSGTTGIYKGVKISEKNIISTIDAFNHVLTPKDKKRVLNFLPLFHGMPLIISTIGPIYLGHSLCILNKIDGQLISEAMIKYKPHYMACVPEVLLQLANKIKKGIEEKSQTQRKIISIITSILLFVKKHLGVNLGKKVFKKIHEKFGGNIEYIFSEELI